MALSAMTMSARNGPVCPSDSSAPISAASLILYLPPWDSDANAGTLRNPDGIVTPSRSIVSPTEGSARMMLRFPARSSDTPRRQAES